MTHQQMIELEPYTLIEVLTRDYFEEIPSLITTIEDMNTASQKLLKLASSYSYISSLLSYAKVMTRYAKRNLSKSDYEDMVDKKEIIANVADAIKQQYNAISRAVTINIENRHELNMVGR